MGAVVSRPDLVEVYVKLGLKYDLPMLFLRKIEGPLVAKVPIACASGGRRCWRPSMRRHFPVLDSLVQFYGGDTHEAAGRRHRKTFRTLPPGVSQLIIHCGFADDELRAITAAQSTATATVGSLPTPRWPPKSRAWASR